MMQFTSDSLVCFDLDDTLYKEIDYVRSAYREIAEFVEHPEVVTLMLEWYRERRNVFESLNRALGLSISIEKYLSIYRNHIPSISLSDGAEDALDYLRGNDVILGLITDGRMISQRHKIQALRLDRWFREDNIIISEEFGSEKPLPAAFEYFMGRYPSCHDFTYVGDNPVKDFIAPNVLGWRTICLEDDGWNIHEQNLSTIPEGAKPKVTIESLRELIKSHNNV